MSKQAAIENDVWQRSTDAMGENPIPGAMPNKWDRLTEARKAKGLSQRELAGIIGVTQTTLSHWEGGDELLASAIPFLKMSLALDVPLDWLFYNHLVVGSNSEDGKRTMAKAAEILSRLYIKK